MGPFRTADTAAKVYDPVNDRLVVIYPDGDVWAVTTDTGKWIELTESG